MSSDVELFNNVEASIRAVLNTKQGEITPQSFLVKDLGAESIDFLDISCELEKLVGTELDFKDVIKTSNRSNDLTAQDIVDYLKKRSK